jgi:hypothetical protein
LANHCTGDILPHLAALWLQLLFCLLANSRPVTRKM